VIGLGLVGGSVGAALRRADLEVRGFDTDDAVAARAVQRGLVDAACSTMAAALEHANTVVLAVPVIATRDLLVEVDRLAPHTAMIMDTGSVKRPIVDAMDTLIGRERTIGGHPLAGRERSGPDAADPDLFRHRTFVLTPAAYTSKETIERAIRLVDMLGGQPVIADAAEHDRILARTSHLPQLLSTALALTAQPADPTMAGPAFSDMIRLAASDPGMWRDILLTNADNVAEALSTYMNELEGLARIVRAQDSERIVHVMERGRSAYRSLRSEAAL